MHQQSELVNSLNLQLYIHGYNAEGGERHWGPYKMEGLSPLHEYLRSIRRLYPDIVRIVFDLALPVTKDTPR